MIRGIALGVTLILVGMATLSGCAKRTSPEELSGVVRIAGSSTVYPLSVAIAEEFVKKHPKVVIPIQSAGTGAGFKNFFITGKTDINDASRPIEEDELKAAKENGIEPIEFTVAMDGIAVIVNPKADWVDDIAVEDLKHIWRPVNPAKRWSEVKAEWPDEEIKLYGPTSASGTFDYFTEVIVGEERASRSDYQGTEYDNDIIQAISRDRYALGYLGLAYYLENRDKVKALAINGVKPGIETVRSGKYIPLSRPLFIYVNKDSLKRREVQEFVRFYFEQLDTALVEQVGYVPLTKEQKEANLAKLEEAIRSLG